MRHNRCDIHQSDKKLAIFVVFADFGKTLLIPLLKVCPQLVIAAHNAPECTATIQEFQRILQPDDIQIAFFRGVMLSQPVEILEESILPDRFSAAFPQNEFELRYAEVRF